MPNKTRKNIKLSKNKTLKSNKFSLIELVYLNYIFRLIYLLNIFRSSNINQIIYKN